MAKKNEKTTKVANSGKDIVVFTKKNLLTHDRYRNRIDLLGALLDDTKEYSIAEVDTIIDNFMKGKVN